MNLPKVFQNKKMDVNVDNQQTLFYGNDSNARQPSSKTISPKDVETKIKNIFSSTRYVYKLNVTIITERDSIDTTIVGKTATSLITYDNKLIPIKEIKDIYER